MRILGKAKTPVTKSTSMGVAFIKNYQTVSENAPDMLQALIFEWADKAEDMYIMGDGPMDPKGIIALIFKDKTVSIVFKGVAVAVDQTVLIRHFVESEGYKKEFD